MNLNKIFEHIELSAKLLDYFLRCNKSNINQEGPLYSCREVCLYDFPAILSTLAEVVDVT